MAEEILYSISGAPLGLCSKDGPPSHRGILQASDHEFFNDSTVSLALDSDEESSAHQDSSFLPSEEERLHLEITERERLKSMCITFRANPFAFQEINHNGLGRRATAPPAQPHSSPPLLYNFWADPGSSPPALGHTSRRTRSDAHSPPPSPVVLASTTSSMASHDQRPRPESQPSVRVPPRRPQQRHRTEPKESSGSHTQQGRPVKCEEGERRSPLFHSYAAPHKSPANWHGLPSSSTANFQPGTFSYGELRTRSQYDQINSYSWFPHQGQPTRATVYPQPYTPTSSFVPNHPPPTHTYIPGNFTSHNISDVPFLGRTAGREPSSDQSPIPSSFMEQVVHDRQWPRFSSPPFGVSESIDRISPHHGFSATVDSTKEFCQPSAYPGSPSDSSLSGSQSPLTDLFASSVDDENMNIMERVP